VFGITGLMQNKELVVCEIYIFRVFVSFFCVSVHIVQNFIQVCGIFTGF
jgi:hypothetical protein